VLSVIKVGSLDEAIGVNNDVKYGLSSSLYTRDVNGRLPGDGRARYGHHVRERSTIARKRICRSAA